MFLALKVDKVSLNRRQNGTGILPSPEPNQVSMLTPKSRGGIGYGRWSNGVDWLVVLGVGTMAYSVFFSKWLWKTVCSAGL